MAPVSSAAMQTLLVDRKDGVVTVTLNRPEKKNAMDITMWGELLSVFTEVATNDDDRVLVVTGAGDGFCSGADLSALTNLGLGHMRFIGQSVLALHQLAKPTIA